MKLLVSALGVALLTALTPPSLKQLKLNQIQCIGSHNSYKQAIAPALLAVLKQSDTLLYKSLEYSHISLTGQLNLGLQNLEIDIYADAKGGKYAQPMGMKLVKNQPPYDTTGMNEPGFKVLHVQDIDFRSNCPTFKGCLAELKRWSDAHPGHYPVFITMNAKDDTIKRRGFVIPEPFTQPVYDQLDSVILATLGASKLIVPDQIRGHYPTLEAAVLAGNWPTVQAAQGKFLFVLDEKGAKREHYIAGHPSLTHRILFTNSEPGTPEAAFLILNNSIGDQERIRTMVQKGYIVRTRADADTKQARTNDKRNFEAACQSGAQIITTDYYAKSQFFPSEYIVHFPDGSYLRPNPVRR